MSTSGGVIVAEGQGEVSQYTHSTPQTPAYQAAHTSPEQYDRYVYSSSGANLYSMNIMLGFVFIGYFVLLGGYLSMCCFGPRFHGFARFHDVEAAAGATASTAAQAAKPPQMEGPVAQLDAIWRKQFITKVYLILCLQLFVTFGIVYSMMQFGGYRLYVWTLTEGYWTRSASLFTTLGALVSLICFKNRHPLNLGLLCLFTLSMSYSLGATCTAYAAMGYSVVVVEALAITSLLFVGLTLFVRYSKIDFSFLALVIPALLLSLLLFGLVSLFAFDSFVLRQAYALGGTLLFVLYVLFDTSMIMEYLSYDDYVLGAINLYLDFVNLFICILQLLTGGRRE